MSGTEFELPETMHAEDAEPAEATPRRPTPHDETMARLAERRAEQINLEQEQWLRLENQGRIDGGGQPIERESPESTDGSAGAAAPIPRTPEPQAGAASPSATAAPVSEERRHPITIAGAHYLVTDAELAHLASIGGQALSQQQQPPQQAPPQPRQEPPAPPATAPDRDRLGGIVRRLSYGNEEDGVAAAQELLSFATPAPVDQRSIIEQAKAEMRSEAVLQQNLLQIGREFPDVFGPVDRMMSDDERRISQSRARTAALELHDIRQRDALLGVQRPDLEAYREAAQRVKAALGLSLAAPQSGQQAVNQPVSQAAPPTVVATSNDRFERKRAAPRQPTAVGRTPSSGESQRREPTGSEIVAQIARGRHQQSPVRAG